MPQPYSLDPEPTQIDRFSRDELKQALKNCTRLRRRSRPLLGTENRESATSEAVDLHVGGARRACRTRCFGAVATVIAEEEDDDDVNDDDYDAYQCMMMYVI